MAHILIADDDELVAAILADAFARAGHPSHWVPNARAAWESVHERRPDIVLLDQEMPDTPGLALLAKLRVSPLFYDLPVVILSGKRGAVEGEAALRAGAQDFLRKPFDPEALVSRVERLLEEGSGAPPLSALHEEPACEDGIAASALHWQRRLPSPRRL